MKLVVGLGNPGEKYQNTRHNLGFMLVDKLAKEIDAPAWTYSKNLQGFYTKVDVNGEQIELMKPATFMNQSGKSIAYAQDKHPEELKPEDIIIIHDDLDLVLGKIKVRMGGSGAGHHGVESVIKELGTDQFIRVRLGIGNERSHSGEHKRNSFSAEKFVLEEFLPKEKSEVKQMIKQGMKALEIIFDSGVEEAQNQFN